MSFAMIDTLPVVWALIISVSAVLEFTERDFTAARVRIPSAAALALALFDIPPRYQLLAFLFSLVPISIALPASLKFHRKNHKKYKSI